MKKRVLICGAALAGALLCLAACGGGPAGKAPEANAPPAAAAPTPAPTPTPTPAPTPTPMERKYSDYDESGSGVNFQFLDVPGAALKKEEAELRMAEYLYSPWFWEDSDTPLTIDEETIDGREYRVHAVKEYAGEALAARISYPDAPGAYYQIAAYPYSSDPYIRMVSIQSVGDDATERIALEYTQAELEELYARYEEEYGGPVEAEPSVPDGMVAYFRFMYDVGRYVTEDGQYVLKNKWTWSENTYVSPQEAMFSVFLPTRIDAVDCPYTPCSEDVLGMSLGDAMFSSYDNLLDF